MSELIDNLRIRASIRRNALTRKSVQEGKPDRLSDLLEQAANELEAFQNKGAQMSIITAVSRAYDVLIERKWDTVYWAIDLHGVCLKSNYENGGYEFINQWVQPALQVVGSFPETKLILWSSAHKYEQHEIIDFFKESGIHIKYFNENPEVENTKTGCFDEKFYFSLLLDDKAGFDPDIDWKALQKFIPLVREQYASCLQ